MTLAQLLRAHAARIPDASALLCGDRNLSFAELDASTSALAGWLLGQGLKPGDRLALQWPNTIDAVQLYFAAFKAGLIAVPINLRLKSHEIAWILENAGASLCFAPPALAGPWSQVNVRVVTELPRTEAIEACALPAVSDNSVCLILYTSGTTGRPKGAVHTHRSLMATSDLCVRVFEGSLNAMRARGLMVTPLMHSSGLFVLLASLHRGETCVLLPTFDPAVALDAIERFACTITLALPAMLQFIIEEQVRRPRDVSSLRVIFAGGDTVPVALQERARAIMGATLVEGLAQTETGPSIMNPTNAPRLGSLGVVSAPVEARVVDIVGRDVSVDEPGELLIRSPALCSGYWNNPGATMEALQNGWFHTGDLVSRDADGYYWFRGRLKEIIVRGGSNISPQEVEEALYSHPAVLEVGVVGLPHDVWGEIVVAVVAPREGATAGEDEIREHARRFLADYKVPERVHFMPTLPKSATGKVHRKALRDALLGIASPRTI
jgi:acyl-CoA synthetase (AMP-forming)/AMP-acid ligase II